MKKLILMLALLTLARVADAQPTSSTIQKSLTVDTTGTSNVATTNTTTKTSGSGFFCNASSATPSAVGADGRNIAAWCDTNGRLRIDFATIAGSTIDTNSGTKSGGTMRVVIATDQPALTNKLLVTPDSVALPANQSVNVAQINGVTTTMGNGASGTGVQRVTIANDSSGIIALTTSAAQIGHLEANQSSNVAQINGVTPLMGAGNTGTGSPRVTIATDQAAFSVNASGTKTNNNAAPGANNIGALTMLANTSAPTFTDGDMTTGSVDPHGSTRVLQMDASGNAITVPAGNPCELSTPSQVAISQTASTKVISAASSKKNYICTIVLVAGAAEIVNVVEGTGSTCGTGTAAVVGSTTAANGMSFAANGGLSAVGGKGNAISGIGTNVDTCLTQSGSNRVAGWLTYVQQ